MPEIILACLLMIPQTVAAILAKSIGKNPWFWFFISFLIPIISLIVLLFLDKSKEEKRESYRLADHVARNKIPIS